MTTYGIPEKIDKMVKAIYNGSKHAVIDGSGVYDWFQMKTGIKKGCRMPGFLFLRVLDWIMRKTTRYGNIGIRWFLEDLDFADDIALISRRREHIQTKVNNLGRSICKNDNPQNRYSKDHDDEVEQPHKRKGTSRWRRTGRVV